MSADIYDFSGDSGTSAYELIPDGWYEAVITKAEIKVGKNSGKQYIDTTYKLRDDVNQNCKGRLVFEVIASDKNVPNAFDMVKLKKIALTQVGTPNEKMRFNSNDEIVQWLNGLKMKVKVGHEDAANGYEAKNRVNGWNKSEALPTVFGAEGAAKPETVNVEDDDLPF